MAGLFHNPGSAKEVRTAILECLLRGSCPATQALHLVGNGADNSQALTGMPQLLKSLDEVGDPLRRVTNPTKSTSRLSFFDTIRYRIPKRYSSDRIGAHTSAQRPCLLTTATGSPGRPPDQRERDAVPLP